VDKFIIKCIMSFGVVGVMVVVGYFVVDTWKLVLVCNAPLLNIAMVLFTGGSVWFLVIMVMTMIVMWST
jgi:hypothetical protein